MEGKGQVDPDALAKAEEFEIELVVFALPGNGRCGGGVERIPWRRHLLSEEGPAEADLHFFGRPPCIPKVNIADIYKSQIGIDVVGEAYLFIRKINREGEAVQGDRI